MEAKDALSYLDGDVHFLNFPDVAAARDSAIVREKWPKSQTTAKLIDLITNSKPDIILVARDWEAGEASVRWNVFKGDLLSIFEKAENTSGTDGGLKWRVGRVLVDDGEQKGNSLPIRERHPEFGKRYIEIGNEAADKYESISVQRAQWMRGQVPNYTSVYPLSAVELDEPEKGLPARFSGKLRRISNEINRLSQNVIGWEKEASLRHLVTVLDSVSFKIARRHEFSGKDQRALFHWKNALENLRCALLGVRVKISVTEKILTFRQLTYITIEEVEGLSEGRETSVFFGGIEDDWIINEGFQKKFQYRPGDSYRLLTPSELDLTTPQATYGLRQAKLTKPIFLFVIHKAPTKEKSFIHRSIIELSFSAKFSTEILTPIVRVVPGEKLIVRLTNHSRDGVTDTLWVKHELAESTPGIFRLSTKEATYVDTLTLIWKQDPEEGSYLLPLSIKEFNVGKFAARKFEVEVNTNKRVGFITGVQDSPIRAALRRLGLEALEVNPEDSLPEQTNNLDVLIVDRRALTLNDNLKDKGSELDRFVKNGGHLIYLAQDAEQWNESRLWEDIELRPSGRFDEEFPVEMEEEHPFFSSPNRIEPVDWNEWLYLRAYNIVATSRAADVSLPLRTTEDGIPLILTEKMDRGRRTYMDLALHPQLMNIHPGAFRLLANILSI